MKSNLLLNFFLKYFVYLLAFCLYFSTRWVSKNFGDVSFGQVLYHIQFGAENLTDTDPDLIADFFKRALHIPSVLAFIFAVTHLFHIKIITIFINLFKSLRKLINKNQFWSTIFSKTLHTKLLILAFIFATFKFSVWTYIGDQIFRSKVDFYAQNYVHPKSIKLTSTKPKNLILIYVESLENTYNRSDLFKDNLIRRLEPDYIDGQMFNKWRQLPGTNWTIAGIVGTQCGIPLKHSLGGNTYQKPQNRIFQNSSSFLPNATCLGDILKKYGYKNIYMQGAKLKFAGKDTFFRTHGYDEVYGRDEFFKMNNKIPMSNWGVYDDDLLSYAKRKIDELESRPEQPYNLTLLTLDTHLPVGHLSRTCAQRGAKEFKDIVRCTSEMVSELTQHIKNRGYLKNTSIVIVGDHLAMANPDYDKIEKVSERFIFNNYISSDTSLVKNRDEFVHFDHFPTILDSLGINVTGGKLGLGISGFGPPQLTSEQAKNRHVNLKKYILRYSSTYQSFWTPTHKNN